MAKKNIRTHSKKKKALALVQSNQLEQARDLYIQVCKLDKRDADAWFLLGVVEGRLGNCKEAVRCLRNSISLDPKPARSHYNLGIALRDAGKFDCAIAAFEKTLRIDPNYFEAIDSLAHAMIAINRLDEAAAAFRKALKLKPESAEMHSNLGSVYQAQGLLGQAVTCYRKAQQLNPNIAYENLGGTLTSQGKFVEALECFRQGLIKHPGNTKIHSNLLLTLNYLSDQDPGEVFREHRRWGEMHRQASRNVGFSNSIDPEKRLRVGYISPDFRVHSITYFFEPLLAAHDSSVVETYCYSDMPNPDKMTIHIESIADHWRDISIMNDNQVVDLVKSDGIDILVDLAGHTASNRLKVFAFKSAPVQVTYLGYPNTTGLSSIDYRITDEYADPGEQDEYYTEELIRLPGCFLCYVPYEDAPEECSSISVGGSEITFGSFNNLSKLSPDVIALWSRLLKEVPSSKLLIKSPSLTDPETKEYYQGLFEMQGVQYDRIELLGHTPTREEHLKLYSRVDIALDTFPYNGTTTTCEAMWMGVPVVALKGGNHAGRVGVSLLNAVGMQDFIAESMENYVEIAASLADNHEQRAILRKNLRSLMKGSPLCDSQTFTKNIEGEYKKIWHKWCKKMADVS